MFYGNATIMFFFWSGFSGEASAVTPRAMFASASIVPRHLATETITPKHLATLGVDP